MKQFHFSLNNVLQLRTHETKQAEAALSHTRQERELQEAHVEALHDHMITLATAAPAADSLSAMNFRRRMSHREDARKAYDKARHRLDQTRRAENDQFRHLVESRRAEQSIQELRAQQAEAHRQQQLQAENERLDEQALSGYLRKQNISQP